MIQLSSPLQLPQRSLSVANKAPHTYRVFVRKRPLNQKENAERDFDVVSCVPGESTANKPGMLSYLDESNISWIV